MVVATLALAGGTFAVAATARQDMVAAMRALHYPRAGALKTSCRPINGGYRCRAVYQRRRVRRWYAKWKGPRTGGFICTGNTLAGCSVHRCCADTPNGFVPNDKAMSTPRGTAENVARALLVVKYHYAEADIPPLAPTCLKSKRPSRYPFCYRLGDTFEIRIEVYLGRVKTGYITLAWDTTV